MSTKLKLMGVDVASFGDAFATHAGRARHQHRRHAGGGLQEARRQRRQQHLLGGILVGDAADYGQLLQLVQNRMPLPPHPEDLMMPPRAGERSAGLGVDALPDAAQICSCNNVSKGADLRAPSASAS